MFIFEFEILSLLVPLFKIAFFFSLVVGEKRQTITLGGGPTDGSLILVLLPPQQGGAV